MAVTLLRLNTGYDFLAAHLHKIHVIEKDECILCDQQWLKNKSQTPVLYRTFQRLTRSQQFKQSFLESKMENGLKDPNNRTLENNYHQSTQTLNKRCKNIA